MNFGLLSIELSILGSFKQYRPVYKERFDSTVETHYLNTNKPKKSGHNNVVTKLKGIFKKELQLSFEAKEGDCE